MFAVMYGTPDADHFFDLVKSLLEKVHSNLVPRVLTLKRKDPGNEVDSTSLVGDATDIFAITIKSN